MSPRIQFREHTPNRATKLWKQLRPYARLALDGRLLVIDPSVGSSSSQPGYALYEAGQLTDSGVIDIPVGSIESRLFHLRSVLCGEFPEKPDVVVVEDIPVLRFNKFGRSLAAQIPLHYAVGVVLSAFDAPVVRVFPATWHAFVGADYQKSDESDAIVMGHTVLQFARHILQDAHSGRGRGTRARA